MAAAVQCREGARADLRVRHRRVDDDADNLADRIPARKMTAESRTHEQVAHFDVGGHRNIFEFETIDPAGAGGDAAEIIAVHLHRHRVRRVDHEHHATRELRDLDHLAEQAFRVDHGLADEYARV